LIFLYYYWFLVPWPVQITDRSHQSTSFYSPLPLPGSKRWKTTQDDVRSWATLIWTTRRRGTISWATRRWTTRTVAWTQPCHSQSHQGGFTWAKRSVGYDSPDDL